MTAAAAIAAPDLAERPTGAIRPFVDAAVEADAVTMRFPTRLALDGVSLRVAPGEVLALLGPNGAGKTTLLRILAGITTQTAGEIRLAGTLGLVPSGDRTFYLRLSALENLVFFGRLYGLRRKEAAARARSALVAVGLPDSAGTRVALLSHGMQKRLGVARALLCRPAALLIDEATHDLDPEGASRIRELVRAAADREGVGVLWATQRLDEIRGFAERVTLLDGGRTRFTGSVSDLIEHALPRRYILTIRSGSTPTEQIAQRASIRLGDLATLEPVRDDATRFLLELAPRTVLGEALAALRPEFEVLACRQERSEVEEAFLALTGSEAP